MNGRTDRICFSLSISADKYKQYYSGEIMYVVVRSHDGRNVKFPASCLRRFVSHEGVNGEFEIEVDAQHHMKSMRRVR